MTGIGARSVTAVVLFVGAAVALRQIGHLRADYWEQLSPWVPFLAGGFAVLAGTFVFAFWRLGERSEYYFRFGDRLPFAGETALAALGGRHGRAVLVGHAPQVEVIDFPPFVQRAIYIATFSCVALIAITDRAVALLRQVPEQLERRSADYCAEPAAPAPEQPKQDKLGCSLVLRAYKLGYTKDLGSCAPDEQNHEERVREVCRRRQLDEPYPHYAWRLFGRRTQAVLEDQRGSGTLERVATQLDHLGAMFYATLDSVAMRPRSSHHLFTNLPDPRPALRDRVRAALDRETCGPRLAHLPHFPRMDDGEAGPSKLLEHVLAQLLFNPRYKPIVAECKEVVIHWNAPDDACAQLAAKPRESLAKLGAADAVDDVLAWRSRKLELQRIGVRPSPGGVPAAQRIASFQCLIVGDPAEAANPIDRTAALDGEQFHVREARMTALASDGGSQIRLYKQLAAVFAEGFGYGRLTSNQAVGAAPEEATMAQVFSRSTLFLTNLELLRDADLFLGNDWLAKRPELLDAYPYHLHLQNFVEIFRRHYKEHRGRL
jgi:hypothetical protein